MKLTTKGISYLYYGDQFTRLWPWRPEGVPKYYSSIYDMYFNNLREYWIHVGQKEATFIKSPEKLEGFSYHEIIAKWARTKYPREHIVILKDLNVAERGLSFWSRIPKDKLEHLQKDVIVMRCGSKENVYNIVESVESSFAEAFGFSDDILINYNGD